MEQDKKSPPNTLKIISGVLLLATFFMPVASCTRPVPAEPLQKLHEQQMKERLEKSQTKLTAPELEEKNIKAELDIVKVERTGFYYPYKSFDAKDIDSWTQLLGFVWPLPLIGMQFLWRQKARVLILSFLGLGLSLWSMMITFIGIPMFRKMLWPGYLACAAASCLFLLYLAEITPPSWKFIKARIRNLKSR